MKLTADKPMAVVRGNSQFALDLYGRLCGQQGNLFFSPYSLSTALAMTYSGARGETAEQMAAVLHFPVESQQLHMAFAALIQELQGNGKPQGYQLHIANALWGQKAYGFLPSFLALTKQYYGAGLNEVDFARTEAARRTINAWVEEQTQQKIKELLKPRMLDALTRLVLTNAIYFKGNWALQFDKKETRKERFLVTPDQQVPVLMMHQAGRFKYLEEDSFQALELPYIGDRLSVVVFLPRKVGGLAAFEKTLTAENLANWLTKLHSQKVIVHLPKLKVTAEFLLNDVLSRMGMPLAFDSDRADFFGMAARLPGLFISAVVHKAFVDVNEEGTEAAAATAVVERSRSASIAQPPVFRADHPFVFLIRDTRSDSILFLGRLTKPEH